MRTLFLLLFALSSLFAIVDIATVDFADKSEGFSGSAYGSFQKKRGNTEKDEAEYGGRIQLDTPKTITWIQGKVEKDEVRDIETDNNAFIHLRHIHQLYSPSWAMEAYGQLKKDKFKSIQERSLYGLGLRYRVFSTEKYGKLFFGLSAYDERINYTDEEIDEDEHNYRGSAYLSYKLPVNERFDISVLSYYQPKINNGSDFMSSMHAEMTIHLTQVVDLSYLVQFDYDSMPANNVNQTDMVQRLSVIYRFGEHDPLSAYAHNFLKTVDELEDVNASAVVAVEVDTKTEEIEDFRDTLAGKWVFGKEVFTILLDGKGIYTYGDGIYKEQVSWKLISTQTQEGVQAAKDQSTKLVVMRFEDEEGRIDRVENYLWSENTLVGLTGASVRLFKR